MESPKRTANIITGMKGGTGAWVSIPSLSEPAAFGGEREHAVSGADREQVHRARLESDRRRAEAASRKRKERPTTAASSGKRDPTRSPSSITEAVRVPTWTLDTPLPI
jgi:hypothetical protein